MEHSSVDENRTTFQNLFCIEAPIRTIDVILPIALVIFLAVTAFVGNILILIALHKISSLHPPSKLLFRCLAVTDIFVALVAEPLLVIYLFSVIEMNREQRANPNLCFYTATFAITVTTSLCGVSLLTTAAISMDRLLALVLGVRYRHVVTFKRTLVAVLSFWLLGIIFASVSFWKFTLHKSMIFISIAMILVCLAVSAVCYTRMVLILRQRQNQVGAPSNQATFLPSITRLKRIVYSALWVQGILEACYIPFIVVATMLVFNSVERSQSLYMAWEFTGILIFLSSSLNPFLYCYKIREVRQAVKHTIRKVCCLSN